MPATGSEASEVACEPVAGIKNYNYTSEVKQMAGGGKTFHNIEQRKNVKIPLDVYNLIKNDTEFIDLIYKYYKYDILKKLKTTNTYKKPQTHIKIHKHI